MPTETRRIYFENLDALRFIAAFAVLCYHIAAWFTFPDTFAGKLARILLSFDSSGGDAGVNFFFVLSGFLITYLMFSEVEFKKDFNIFFFYLRRVLRIWPLYYLSLAIGFIFYPLVASVSYQEQANWIMYALFLANFDNMFGGWPQTGLLGLQWSVSVEEQFYLVWPVFFLLAKNKKAFPIICFGLIISAQLFILSGVGHYHPLSCLRELSCGALAAWYAFSNTQSIQLLFKKISMPLTFLIYVLGLLLILMNFQLQKRIPIAGPWFGFSHTLFFVFVILEQNYSVNSFFKFGKWKQLTEWGKISYGLYLLHMVAIYFVAFIASKWNISIWLQIPLACTFAIFFGEVSYRYYEKFFLNFKRRLSFVDTAR